MPYRKKADTVALWARVPAADIERIERALPRYGWRVAILREVVAHLANTLKPGSRPSMHTVTHLAKEAADRRVAQYAHGEKRR